MDLMQDLSMQFAQTSFTLYNLATPYISLALTQLQNLKSQTSPILLPYLDTLANHAQNSPAILTIGVFVLILLIAIQILGMVRRMMMWWFRLIYKLIFWGIVAVVIAVVVQRGVERTVGDLLGWGRELSGVWVREYKRWEGVQNQSSGGRQPVYGAKGGYGGAAMGGNGKARWR